MKKEFDLKIDGGTLESIKIDSSNSLIVATYKRDVGVEKLDISEIVVDYESAIKYLGIKDTLLVFKNYDRVDKFNAQIKLQLIAEAWNKFDGFEAGWGNSDQHKHYPIFGVEDDKVEFLDTVSVRRILDFNTSNFSFKTEERARQFGEQFIDLFKVALGF